MQGNITTGHNPWPLLTHNLLRKDRLGYEKSWNDKHLLRDGQKRKWTGDHLKKQKKTIKGFC